MRDVSERCPICGGASLVRHGGRPEGRCADCRSKERTRTVFLLLRRLDLLRPGLSALHVAPEPALAARLHAALGAGYTICDATPEALEPFDPEIPRRVLDLARADDAVADGDASYDVVLHGHVMEHVRGGWQLAFLRLHAALKPGGRHVFAVPVLRPWSREDLSDMPQAERKRRFGQPGRYRDIGRNDFLADMATIAALTGSEPLAAAGALLGDAEMARIAGDPNVFVLRRRPEPPTPAA